MSSHPFTLIERICLIEDLVYVANLDELDAYVMIVAKDLGNVERK